MLFISPAVVKPGNHLATYCEADFGPHPSRW